MPRHLRKNDRTDAAARLTAFLGPEPKKYPKRIPRTLRVKHIEEVRDRMKRKEYVGMTPGKLVAMYWVCHEKVYGVVPVEIDNSAAWKTAMLRAGSMVKRHFDGDMERAITFMRWVWTREQKNEEWRRANNRDGRRISWQNQFSHDFLITDWRAAGMRR